MAVHAAATPGRAVHCAADGGSVHTHVESKSQFVRELAALQVAVQRAGSLSSGETEHVPSAARSSCTGRRLAVRSEATKSNRRPGGSSIGAAGSGHADGSEAASSGAMRSERWDFPKAASLPFPFCLFPLPFWSSSAHSKVSLKRGAHP
eukprot:5528010-Prymnesium_polylepis.1